MRPVSIPIFIERQWEPIKVNIPPPQPLDGATYTSWRDRKKNIDDALSWLRTELSNLKIQDQQILGQLRRCQDTIENLKIQKNTWHDGDMSEDDLDEDEGHWEDWEISEFDRAFDKSINECKDLEKECLDLETDFETRRKTPSVSSSLSSPNSDKHSKYFHKYSESESSSGSSSYIRQDIEVTV
ncbi:hypothetical protein SNE40_006126 [Patella caerulea]|uniref:Uncharacterized protein n=1 Tax=Patella caerulea TaxID=87958 RepID=A0AAN8K0D8_PATCE